MESVRLSYSAGKKTESGIKTTSRTIKTTKRTIKTTNETVRESSKAVYKAAQTGVKMAVRVAKKVGDAVVSIIAGVASPWILAAVFIFLMVMLLGTYMMLLMSGGTAAANATKRAYEEAAGLVDVDPEYDRGKQILEAVWNDKRDEFNRLIDSLYYDPNNLTHSNLVYLERTKPEAQKLIFEKGFPTDAYKDNIKNNAWDYSFREEEILAIVYVYMEMLENQANSTTDAIYPVAYTEDAVRAVIDKCVMFNDSVYAGQYCKDQNCTVHSDRHKNTEWERANDENNRRWNTYWDWYNNVYPVIWSNGAIQDSGAAQAHWNNTVQPAIDRWQRDHNRTAYNVTWNRGFWFCDSVLLPEARDSERWKNNTPEYITDTSYSCEHAHDLHSIGLAFYSAEDVMNALGFSDNEKQWADMTIHAFEQQNAPQNTS